MSDPSETANDVSMARYTEMEKALGVDQLLRVENEAFKRASRPTVRFADLDRMGIRRPLTLRLDHGFWPRNLPVVARARAWLIGLLLRVPMSFGRVVILIGPCRSGKTVLLKRATPSKVIDKSALRRREVAAPVFDLADVPTNTFSIDEAIAFDADSLLGGLESLRGRGFAIAFQAERQIDEMGLTGELMKKHRCIVLKLGRN